MKRKTNLNDFFRPNLVAVIGATDRKGSVGRAVLENLVDGFKGKVVPINPEHDELFGLRCYSDVSSFSEKIDLAIVVVPANISNEVIRRAAKEGVKNFVVITAGYGEAGSAGAGREKELQKIAHDHDLNVVGPNSLGVISTPLNLNATFSLEDALPGSISFLSQSGALITSVLSWAADRGIGFRNIVSLGNKAVLDETDFLQFMGEEEGTDVIIAYLEGIEEGKEFISTARKVTKSTPVVMIKSGRTEAGARAVSSHTGALAGSENAYKAGLKQAGIIRVENIQRLFDFGEVLTGQPIPSSEDMAVVTNSGGPGIMATDAFEASGLSLASFSEETLRKLEKSLPGEANIYNPVDVLGDAGLDRFEKAIDATLNDSRVGGLVVISYPSAILEYEDLAELLVEVKRSYDKPIVSSLMGGDKIRSAENILRDEGIPNYFDPERAVRSLGALNEYKEIRKREYEEPERYRVDRKKVRKILARVKGMENKRLGVEAMELLDLYGIPTPEGEVFTDPEEAVNAAEKMGEEVAMKIVSPDISHKSDIGGVKLGVSPDEVRDEFEDLIIRAKNYQHDATLIGVQVQEMIDLENGIETILGMNRDPQFGPLLMFGLGGIYVEILNDASFRIAPVSEGEAKGMVNELKTAPLLRGARGRKPVDTDEIVNCIQKLSQMVIDFPAVLELDINPLVVFPEGVKAVDLRLTIEEEELRL